MTSAGRASRSSWTLWARLAVSVLLLAILVRNVPDFDGILPEQHHATTVAFLVLALCTTIVGIVLSAWRWQRVLAAFDADVPVRTLTTHYLAGLFVGNVLPSTIGGDVVRVSRCNTTVGSSTTAFGSVVIERLTGFIALPALVVLGFVVRPSLLGADHAWVPILIAGITLGALAVIITLAAHPRIAGRFTDRDNWMRFIGAVHLGVDRLRREPRRSAEVLGASLLYQASVVLTVGIIMRALDLPVPVAAVIAFVPAVAMAQVLPISISGLGVREGMLVLLLHGFGVGSGQAIAVGLLWYAGVLISSMLGAPAFAMGNRAPNERSGARTDSTTGAR